MGAEEKVAGDEETGDGPFGSVPKDADEAQIKAPEVTRTRLPKKNRLRIDAVKGGVGGMETRKLLAAYLLYGQSF